MEHSDYTKLKSLFDYTNTGNQLLHWSQNEGAQYMADPNSKGFLMWQGITPGFWYIFARDNSHNADQLNELLMGWWHSIWAFMDSHEDDFYHSNQQRADNHNGPTNDFIALFRAMTGYLSGPMVKVPKGQKRGLFQALKLSPDTNALASLVWLKTQKWVDQATTWFPNLNDQIEHQAPANPTKAGRNATVTIDRERLKQCFNKEFNTPQPGKQLSRCDMLYYAMSGEPFTKTDWGRVAYAIKHNFKIVANDVVLMDFAPWLKLFFSIIGLEPPKDTRRNKYQDEAGTRSFNNQWLR